MSRQRLVARTAMNLEEANIPQLSAVWLLCLVLCWGLYWSRQHTSWFTCWRCVTFPLPTFANVNISLNPNLHPIKKWKYVKLGRKLMKHGLWCFTIFEQCNAQWLVWTSTVVCILHYQWSYFFSLHSPCYCCWRGCNFVPNVILQSG
jgi:hypothetical protein